MRAAASNEDVRVGMMLRDAEHRPRIVEALATSLVNDVPDNVVVITNAVAAGMTSWIHLPYYMHRDAQRLRLEGMHVGVSVHSVHEARSAAGTCDYMVASPVHETLSKPGHAGIGIQALSQICTAVESAVFALGGLTVNDIEDCLEAGAHGIAGISMFATDEQLYATFTCVREYANRLAERDVP